MHVGKGDKESKTEAVFFTSRTKIQSWFNEYERNLLLDTNLKFRWKLKKSAKLLRKTWKLLLTDIIFKQNKLNNLFSKIIVLSHSLENLITFDHEYRMI